MHAQIKIHQLFIARRNGQIKDVMIDMSESAAGITVFYYIDKIMK
jgi:VanZ family protein